MDLFKNGSVWLKADFHLHTKSDKEFIFNDVDEIFIKKYVRALKENEIGLGVITNHNKFNKEEFKLLKKEAAKDNIGLFPGVELSIKEGIHILIVFDNKWYSGHQNNIQIFLDSAFLSIPNYYTPDYPNSRYDLEKTVEALDQFGDDYFIIMAHVDEDNGLFRTLKGRTLEAFVKNESFEKVLALQKSANKENYKKLKAIIGREIACVEGTDNACNGIDAIGKGRVTFLKVGDFNIEALKYALIDINNRIHKKTKPIISNCYIKSLKIEGNTLKTDLNFSPELNSLIGIRGSGKSTIIEILRYALGIPLNTQSMDKKYKSDLLEFALGSGGKITAIIVNNFNDEYRIEKIFGHKETIFKNGSQDKISLNAIFRNMPVYFGQKDLSNKDLDFEADLVNKLIGNRLDSVREDIKKKRREIDNLVSDLLSYENLEELKRETNQLITDANHTLKQFKEMGVEKKLKQQSNFDADITMLDDLHNEIIKFIQDLNRIIENYSDFFNGTIPSSSENKEIFDNAIMVFDKIKSEYHKIPTLLKNITTEEAEFQNIISTLTGKKEGLKEEFAKIKREINVPNLNPDEFLKLNRQIETSKLKLKEIEKSEQKRKYTLRKLDSELSNLSKLWHQEYEKLQSEVDRINKLNNPITIEIKYKGRRDKFTDKMRQTFKGSNIRDNTYQMISQEFPDFIEIYKNKLRLIDILNENQYSAFNRIFVENLSELLTYQVSNQIIINYKGKPLAKHSLGQRASALILFLLAQDGTDILIIDQPEDDLDNQTIYEDVIKELKSLKSSMQFIFATHNANIPVLGDSEKVFTHKYENNEIKIFDSTIDNIEMHEEIVGIMEGGKEAFKQRKKIYGLWRIEN